MSKQMVHYKVCFDFFPGIEWGDKINLQVSI